MYGAQGIGALPYRSSRANIHSRSEAMDKYGDLLLQVFILLGYQLFAMNAVGSLGLAV